MWGAGFNTFTSLKFQGLGLQFKASGLRFRIQDVGCRVQGIQFIHAVHVAGSSM